MDNDNVVRGLEKRLRIRRADAMWAVVENWAADSQELKPGWGAQLGVGADGGLWEVLDLLLERMEGKVEVQWVRGHEGKRTTRRMMGKHQRGSMKADANCTAVKRGLGARLGCCCLGGRPGGCAMMWSRWRGCSGRSWGRR